MNSVHSLIDAPAPASAQGPAPLGAQAGLHLHDHAQEQPQPHHHQLHRLASPTPIPVSAPAQGPGPGPVGGLSLSPSAPASAPTPVHTPRPDDLQQRQLPPPTTPSMTHYAPIASPPMRQDTGSSISTQATTATLASTETNNTSYSADTSPNLHQSIFSLKDGSDVSNSRRTSRRRTGPLSQQSRERAALIRKLGACVDCRRRRVACHPSHHNMTWEDVVSKFHRSHSPAVQDIAPSLAAAGRPLSPATTLNAAQPMFTHDPQEMEIDASNTVAGGAAPNHHHQPGRPPLSEARIRTPLPTGPRLEKSMSLPGIESLKNDIQTNAARMLSATSRGRYSSVQALLLFWQDDDEAMMVQNAVRELADVFDKYYHYTFHIQTIPSSSEGCKSSWRWLSRKLNDFAEERDQRDVLKIVYYIGHTYLDGNRDMVLASSKDPERASTIRWSGIQQILEEACSDTLIIMDAAYYPPARIVRQQGVLEIIAASLSEDHLTALDRCAFTLALAEQLRTRAARQTPLSVVELHSILMALYPKMARDPAPEREMVVSFPAPLHTMMSGNSRLPSIFLSPVQQNSPLRSSFSYENSPQLHLAIKLNDENIDIDSWNEWLRMMPEGIKDIKIDGPFRATFR